MTTEGYWGFVISNIIPVRVVREGCSSLLFEYTDVPFSLIRALCT